MSSIFCMVLKTTNNHLACIDDHRQIQHFTPLHAIMIALCYLVCLLYIFQVTRSRYIGNKGGASDPSGTFHKQSRWKRTGGLHENKIKQILGQKDVQIIREKKQCEYAHNKIRELHEEHPLVWSDELAYDAEEWAIYLAAFVGKLEHSDFKFDNGSSYGELVSVESNGKITGCNVAVHSWYSEIHGYDYKVEHPDGWVNVAGHFTQLVWNTTVKFGVGVAFIKGKTYVVGRYLPPSLLRDYDEHIPKPKSGPPTIRDLTIPGDRKPFVDEIEVIVPPENVGCFDKQDSCEFQVEKGDCVTPLKKDMMLVNCFKSCTNCTRSPINGRFSDWFELEECPVSCGGGYQAAHRYCNNPPPRYGGRDCDGERSSKVPCNEQACPGSVAANKESAKPKNNKATGKPSKENAKPTKSKQLVANKESAKPKNNKTADKPSKDNGKPTKIKQSDERTSTSTEECINENVSCDDYEELEYCLSAKYSQWMFLHCKKSCGFCNKKYLDLKINP